MRAVRSRLASDRGFTLVELLAAMVILVIGVMATIGVMDRSRQLSNRSDARATVTLQAENEIERIAALPFNRIGHRTAPTFTAGTPAAQVTGTAYKFDQ